MERKMGNILKRMMLTFLLFLNVLYLLGCDTYKIPEKVEGYPNTFRREPFRSEEKVLSVLVWDTEEIVWYIMAAEPINLKDFKVHVGIMPEGFEQMIPPSNQKFTPVIGNKYSIVITTDVKYYACAYVLELPISWIAEE